MTLGIMEDVFITLSSAGVTGSEHRVGLVPVSPVCAPTLKVIDFFKPVVPTAAVELANLGS